MKKNKNKLLIICVVISLLLIVGAGVFFYLKNNSILFGDEEKNGEVSYDSEDTDDIIILAIGDKVNLKDHINNNDEDISNLEIKVVSNSDNSVINVLDDGNIMALQEGESKIKFIIGDKEYNLNFAVVVETSNAATGVPNNKINSSLNGSVTIKDKKLKKVTTTKQSNIAQGFCSTNDYYVALKLHKIDVGVDEEGNAISESKETYFKIYSRKNNKFIRRFSKYVGHGNGLTCIQNGSKLSMIVIGDWDKEQKRTRYCYVTTDLSNKQKSTKTCNYFYFKEKVRGISRDSVTGKYYFMTGTGIFRLNYDFSTIGRITEENCERVANKVSRNIDGETKYTTQDIEVHNNIAYVVQGDRGLSGTAKKPNDIRNGLDIYDVIDGNYMGTYKINYSSTKEFESLDNFSGNEFGLYFHVNGKPNSYVYKVNLDVK